MDIDSFQMMLDEIAEDIPEDLLKHLNGGILIQSYEKKHPTSEGLSILGEYCVQPATLGRYIVIYYGSFMHVFPHLSEEALRNQVRKTLLHELRHHIESLAGDRSLEIEDMQFLFNYLNTKPDKV